MRRFYTMGSGKYTLGVCAMQNKIESSSMKSILSRIILTGEFTIIVFMQEMILNEDISTWPKVDCLISFYSSGFPLSKAISYFKMNNPVTLNNLEKQIPMRSRLEIYNILDKWNIPRPECIVINHSEILEANKEIFVEEYDSIIYKGKKIMKPFIEKPIFSDNHDNWIYYPQNSGGGCKKLFRKIGDRSSEYHPNLWKVRKDATYIYEQFLPTFGTDIKVYTVGPMFAHAEARKSPCLDGKVQRTQEGKEVRYSVMLSYEEKLIAHQIVKAFDQTICGFDILRTINGRSVVCDVNGWSFVKGNEKYYNDCAQIIRSLFLKKLYKKYKIIPRFKIEKKPRILEENIEKSQKSIHKKQKSTMKCNTKQDKDLQKDELSTVIVIMRHGVRKPKLKLKFETQDFRILSLLSDKEETRLKSPEELSLLLSKNTLILENLFMSLEDHSQILNDLEIHSICKILNDHLRLQAFLGDGRGFSGVNRKVQLKRIIKGELNNAESKSKKVLIIAKWGGELTSIGCEQAEELGRHLRATLYPGDSQGLLRLHSTFRHDFKIYSSDEGRCQVTSAAFTKGFLDLEGDLAPILVQLVIRDSFAQYLLDDPKILSERNKCKDIIEKLLNINKIVENEDIQRIWNEFQYYLKEPKPTRHVEESLFSCENPYSVLMKLYLLMKDLLLKINIEKEDENNVVIYEGFRQSLDSLFRAHGCEKKDGFPVSHEMMQRWNQLTNTFYNEDSFRFITAKIPDIMDNAIYDICYNIKFVKPEVADLLFEIYDTVLPIGEFVTTSQYGLTNSQKINIGKVICQNLIEKLLQDIKYSHLRNLERINTENKRFENKSNKVFSLKKKKKNSLKEFQKKISSNCFETHPEEHIRLKEEEAQAFGIKSPWRIVRSRFYVTSASHIQSLANIFSSALEDSNLNSDLESPKLSDNIFSDLNYLSHIVIRVWENRSSSELDKEKYRLEMFISKGVKNNIQQIDRVNNEKYSPIQDSNLMFPLKSATSKYINISEFEEKIRNLI